ncbi:imidazole glycerol phosphate synthase subunit HisH [Sphingosinicella microcystinivorans]|uniref:imidazole glycerol phosphate synthase subunit HisH n=1 Tax=Sphingosinicella microcystinivorans TaxID=335406 RepID=UPI001C6C3D44|nr:imidazole glycerol phosphate synthase subunit HisH [Sphingosinicella microcystinivorans]MBW7947113.1 imidazole glycerol phosphate synthase subunit HisH [Sphingomonadaceae bacterium]WBX85650.1 imidazole glycerol phosphate synthase subunit HisH [Sphingosinicella microcystinivorans]
MAERIAVIDYGAGNLRSVAKALEAASNEIGVAVQIVVTDSPSTASQADRIVLPGVGAFGQCATSLRAIDGMEDVLSEVVLVKQRPFLGICVGMQLLAKRGEEKGIHQGLGWIPGKVVKLDPHDPNLKIPHMGWSPVSMKLAGINHEALRHVEDGGEAYFVHSFHFECTDHSHLLATCDYGGPITAIIGRDNILGAQFHPEKSQHYGLSFLAAFLGWTP